jgi:SAM-dependent methyltransferase
MIEKFGYEYLLGDGESEIDRLRFQHSVWGPVTERFFDRLGVKSGWRCLDVGAGPGFVSIDLRCRVGNKGEVSALEPSDFFCGRLSEEIKRQGWKNLHIMAGNSFDAQLPPLYYDLIFTRWVIGFVPQPEAFLQPLLAALKPGGIIAIQDYVHEGCALFPRGGAWDAFPEKMRQWWRSGGGDPFVGARLPAIMRGLGLMVNDYTPTSLTGGPDSAVMEWMGRFFTSQLPVMVERNILTRTDADAMMADWNDHLKNDGAVFFSPFVVDVAGQKPLE